MPIAVLIADARGAASEAFIGRTARAERQQQLPVFTGIDVSLTGPRRACDYIGNAVGVDIPRTFQPDPQTFVRGLPCLRPEQFACLAGVDIDAPRPGSLTVCAVSRGRGNHVFDL